MEREWKRKGIIAPSMICLDLCNLEQQVQKLWTLGVRVLHIDILDGYFSPSMPLGLDVVRQLRKRTDMLFDIHLMATQQDFFIDELLDIGVQQITFHIECENHIDHQLNRIKNEGVRAGIALKPSTGLSGLEYVLEKCDVVLLMLINPGYAGSSIEVQVPYAGRKIEDLREIITSKNLDVQIEIDGRISARDIEIYAPKLADIFVAGSTCIALDDFEGSFERLKMITDRVNDGSANQSTFR